MSLSVHNIGVDFGGTTLLKNISFQISPKDKIGLVGKNGAGKSTMLKIISKYQKPTSGEVSVPKDFTIGYLPQHLICNNTLSVIEETERAFEKQKLLENKIDKLSNELTIREDYESDGYAKIIDDINHYSQQLDIMGVHQLKANAELILKGLGFNIADFNTPTSELSGGWRMRIELAKILLQNPDIILLDEPTNHLDIESIQWLELFLKRYKGSVILISHDRRFLDEITNRTIEISLGKIYDYKAPYSKYLELRQEHKAQQLAAYKNQQKQIKDTQDFIDRFRAKASKAVQVQSRIKQLEKMKVLEIEPEDNLALKVKFNIVRPSGKVVYNISDLAVGYAPEKNVLSKVNLLIERGQRYAFVGKNGQGKSTLSKTILGELTPSKGNIEIGHEVKVGYFAQNQADLLDGELTVFDTIDHIAKGEIRTKIRDILGAFMFGQDSIDKKVKVLSGGEKTRLAMIKLLLEPHNVLILDEPTNHLDLKTKEILKNAFMKYEGTVIIVSHDRHFLDGMPDKVIEFSEGKIKEHLGGLEDFLKSKQLESFYELEKEKAESKPKRQSKPDKKSNDFQKNLNRIESKIHKQEEKIATLESKIAENPSEELMQEYGKIKTDLDKLVEQWEEMIED